MRAVAIYRPLLLVLALSSTAAKFGERLSVRWRDTIDQRQSEKSEGLLRAGRRSSLLAAFQIGKTRWNAEDIDPRDVYERPFLIQFTGRNDDYCASMEPLKVQLKKELGVEIRCFEVWYTPANLKLMNKLDRNRCGGVPFFYNKKSGRWICGATTYKNLRDWAMCLPCEPFCPPPAIDVPKEDKPPDPKTFRGKIGIGINKIKQLADEKMKARSGEGGEAN